jgi:CRISPR/Cas system-associated endonuclease Cas3-HD
MSMGTNLASNLITQAPSKMLANATNLISSFKLITSVVEPKKSKWLKRNNVVIISYTLGRSLDSNFESSTRHNKRPHQKKFTGNRHAQNCSNSNYNIILHTGWVATMIHLVQ